MHIHIFKGAHQISKLGDFANPKFCKINAPPLHALGHKALIPFGDCDVIALHHDFSRPIFVCV